MNTSLSRRIRYVKVSDSGPRFYAWSMKSSKMVSLRQPKPATRSDGPCSSKHKTSLALGLHKRESRSLIVGMSLPIHFKASHGRFTSSIQAADASQELDRTDVNDDDQYRSEEEDSLCVQCL